MTQKRLATIGGPVDGVVVTLRVAAEALDADEISRSLGCAPTTVVAEAGKRVAWILAGPPTDPPDPDAAICALLERVTPDPAVWAALRARADVEIVCAVYLERLNRGFALSPATLGVVRRRHVPVRFDVCVPAPVLAPAAYPSLMLALLDGPPPERPRLRAAVLRELAHGVGEELEVYMTLASAVLGDVDVFREVVRRRRDRCRETNTGLADEAAALVRMTTVLCDRLQPERGAPLAARLRAFAGTLA